MAEIHVERKRGVGAWVWLLLLLVLIAAAALYLWQAGYINMSSVVLEGETAALGNTGGLYAA